MVLDASKLPCIRPHDGIKAFAYGTPLTEKQYLILGEYVLHGSYKAAADCMGIAKTTVRNNISIIHSKLGTQSTLETLARLGWIQVPKDIVVH